MESIQDNFVTLETAKKAKEKGFDYPTLGYFLVNDEEGKSYFLKFNDYEFPMKRYESLMNNFNVAQEFVFDEVEHFSCPTQEVLKKWLRVKHTIVINVRHHPWNQEYSCIVTGAYQKGDKGVLKSYDFKSYTSYEEALEEGLQEGLELIEKYSNEN